MPVGIGAWYWGKLAGRFLVVFLPVFVAMLVTVIRGMMQGQTIPWFQVLFSTGLLAAFLTWLSLLLFLDLIPLGPAAYVILDSFGYRGDLAWAMSDPILVGLARASLGFRIFKRGDYS